jgi:hypothetical protein
VLEFDGAAGLHDLEHGDKTFVSWTLTQRVSDEIFLVGLALERLKRNAGLVGLRLGMIDEGLRLELDER